MLNKVSNISRFYNTLVPEESPPPLEIAVLQHWLLPTAVKHADYLRVNDIDFSSAKKMKSDLDKSIESLDPADDSFTAADFTRCSTLVSNKTKSRGQDSCLVDNKPFLEERLL